MTTALTIWREEFYSRWEAGGVLGWAIYCLDCRPKEQIWADVLEWSSRNAKENLEIRNREFRKQQKDGLVFALEHAKISCCKTPNPGVLSHKV
jgi:hypothetical protein